MDGRGWIGCRGGSAARRLILRWSQQQRLRQGFVAMNALRLLRWVCVSGMCWH